MTDDKGASEGPYDHILASNKEWCVFYCPECAYQAGRKAERERCLEIARGYSSCEGIAQKIAKEIEEAQDGK